MTAPAADTAPSPLDALLDAALGHVPFDGWSDATLRAAAADAGIDPAVARALFPRGGVDMAAAFHRRGDAAMLARIAHEDLSGLRFRDRIAAAVRFRLEAVPDRECVRRAAALFALPPHATQGARLFWDTSDAIWTALGDTADDINWYTKRATLSGVYSATVLYWLGDTSPGDQQTWDFLDRRIDEVMQIERVKGALRRNPLFRAVFSGPLWALGQVRAPARMPAVDLPGSIRRPLP